MAMDMLLSVTPWRGLPALPLLVLFAACATGPVDGEVPAHVPTYPVPDESAADTALPPDVEALKATFNQDAGSTRLLLLMSPA